MSGKNIESSIDSILLRMTIERSQSDSLIVSSSVAEAVDTDEYSGRARSISMVRKDDAIVGLENETIVSLIKSEMVYIRTVSCLLF